MTFNVLRGKVGAAFVAQKLDFNASDGDVVSLNWRIQRNCAAEIAAFRKNLSVYLSLAERRPEALRDLTGDAAASPQLKAAVIRALKRQFDAISKNER